MEVYLESNEAFEGQGEFLSKFGLELRDQIEWTIAVRTFKNEIANRIYPQHINPLRPEQPAEGDLIWLPMFEKPFQIQNVKEKSIFYQFGGLPVYKIMCQYFEYSNQIFETGIEKLDNYYNLKLASNNVIDIDSKDSQAMNSELQSEGSSVVVFTNDDFEGKIF